MAEELNPWTKKLDDTARHLRLWDRAHPTMHGRKIIVEWVIGGRIQYLTKVQGMPKTTEQTFVTMIRNFIWKD